MSQLLNGGPAFPYESVNNSQDTIRDPFGFILPPRTNCNYSGLSARDYFAAKAMGGMLACPIQPASGPDMYARDAYAIADAMLAERAK